MSFFRKPQPQPASSAAMTPPDGMVNLIKSAAVSLEKKGLQSQKAAVYLVLDRSGSMSGYYRNGSVQTLAEQALGLSANLDDDGTVPLIFFDDFVYPPIDITLTAYTGVVERENRRLGRMGLTSYAPAIRQVIAHYRASGATDPAFVIFQTDGDPDDRAATEAALRDASKLPIFWSFVGFGQHVQYLTRLDELEGRKVDNASLVIAPTGQLGYDELLAEFPQWLRDARAARIVQGGI